MIDLTKIEIELGYGPDDETVLVTRGEMLEIITRLRQAEKLNAELKERISHIGLDVGIATTGQVPSEHPIKSRLEMVAKLAKDAARYRFMRDSGKFAESGDEFDSAIDEAMNGSNN